MKSHNSKKKRKEKEIVQEDLNHLRHHIFSMHPYKTQHLRRTQINFKIIT